MDQGFSKRLVPVPLSRKDYGKLMVIYMPVLTMMYKQMRHAMLNIEVRGCCRALSSGDYRRRQQQKERKACTLKCAA